MKIKEKIGLIGVGNMGTAILEGLLKKKQIAGSQAVVYDKISEKAAAFAKRWKAVRVLLSSSRYRRPRLSFGLQA